MMMIRDLQFDMAYWRQHNFPQHTADQQLMGVVEEVGELAHAHLKGQQRIRGFQGGLALKRAKEDAVADIFIFLMGYCDRETIDFESALLRTWDEVKIRDWVAWPDTGRPPEEVQT